MFLNNLSIYSVPLIGIVFLIIGLGFLKTTNLYTYKLSKKQKKQLPVNNYIHDLQKSQMSIQLNPFSKLDDVSCYHDKSTTLSLDDDQELIELDLSSLSASKFCENHVIELRLDQDLEYDNEVTNENDN